MGAQKQQDAELAMNEIRMIRDPSAWSYMYCIYSWSRCQEEALTYLSNASSLLHECQLNQRTILNAIYNCRICYADSHATTGFNFITYTTKMNAYEAMSYYVDH